MAGGKNAVLAGLLMGAGYAMYKLYRQALDQSGNPPMPAEAIPTYKPPQTYRRRGKTNRRSPSLNKTTNRKPLEIKVTPTDETFKGGQVIDRVIQQLKIDEGFDSHWYKDTKGFWTIGYGFKDGGLADQLFLLAEWKPAGDPSKIMKIPQAAEILTDCVYYLYPQTRDLLGEPTWTKLTQTQRAALVNMAFQLGVDGLGEFTKTLNLIREGKYADAVVEARRSDWAEQTPTRAYRTSRGLA